MTWGELAVGDVIHWVPYCSTYTNKSFVIISSEIRGERVFFKLLYLDTGDVISDNAQANAIVSDVWQFEPRSL